MLIVTKVYSKGVAASQSNTSPADRMRGGMNPPVTQVCFGEISYADATPQPPGAYPASSVIEPLEPECCVLLPLKQQRVVCVQYGREKK
jgi:hypothetical protein